MDAKTVLTPLPRWIVSARAQNGRYWTPAMEEHVRATTLEAALGKAGRALVRRLRAAYRTHRRITALRVTVLRVPGTGSRTPNEKETTP